jgi:hypothetical protein
MEICATAEPPPNVVAGLTVRCYLTDPPGPTAET